MRVWTGLASAVAFALLAGCSTQDALTIEHVSNRVEHPLPAKMRQKLARMNLSMSAPIMIRIFKEEEVMEIWKADSQDRYKLVATYPICAWSGQLGPKRKEGDRQAPEGFYNVSQAQLNPNSQYYLSIDMGYPNKFDRAHGRTGRHLMIHGACSSSGCYSISDAAVLQVYAFAREAFRGGQKQIQIQAFPFRMTAENMAKHRGSEHFEFWKNLKVGYDHFEITHRPPVVDVCGKQYVFNQVNGCGSGTPPTLTAAYQQYSKSYEAAFASATAKFPADAWKDIPEFERKAAERLARRKGMKRNVPNDADYVVVDPTAKPTPTSDSVPSFAQAYAKIEAKRKGIESPVEYISVAELEYRKKLEEAKRKETEQIEKHLAKAKVPVPEANPMKPVVAEPTEIATARKQSLPFWKLWDKKPAGQKQEVAGEEAITAETAEVKQQQPLRAQASAAPVEEPVETTQKIEAEPKAAEKPFWKIW